MKFEIHTDAAYNQQEKVGGFAYWINYDHGQLIKSGHFISKLENPAEAEIKCIANALFEIGDLAAGRIIDKVTIFTDCIPAISLLRNYRTTNKSKQAMIARDSCLSKIKELMPASSHKKEFISYEYVPAHSKSGDRYSHINNFLDSEAKRWMYFLLTNLPAYSNKSKSFSNGSIKKR